MSLRKIVFVLALAALGVFASAQQKFALVIGNGDYDTVRDLANPANDAGDMARTLIKLGFTVETLVDAERVGMEEAAARLRTRLSASKDSYGFLFYAGHAVEYNGVNYLIPSDASIPDPEYLPERTVSMQTLLAMLNTAGNALNLVVLDACRDNPFAWSAAGRTAGVGRGLSAVGNQPPGSIVVYATAAGSIADDGDGRNGLFTGHLLTHLATPGLEITEVFRRTMGDVARASGNRQHPAVYNQFSGLAYLAGSPAHAPAVAAAPRVERPVPGGFVRVEGGTFLMGTNDGDGDEKPVHSVTVKSFSMGRTEVTQKEWVDVMSNNLSRFEGDNRPVERVNWNEVVEYCNRRSVKEGLTPAYTISGNRVTWNRNADGYRLPTEAEWEFAARGGTKGGAGYGYSGSDNADAVAWNRNNSGSTTHDVGTKAANSLGIYDMSGNVYEWCWDWYGGYSSGAQTDPLGVFLGSFRVYRGGSWFYPAEYARSALRDYGTPSTASHNLGFRLVRP